MTIFYDAAMQALTLMGGNAPDADELAMIEATDSELLAWVDDLESRMGWDVGDFRSFIVGHCLERAGAWESSFERDSCLAEAQP